VAARLSYDLSCERLRELGLLDDDGLPPLPERMPQQGDEVLGFSVFRMRLDDSLDLSGLTLPRTFFGRSLVNRVSFRNCDLRESNLCWNDFVGTDFTGADLTAADMRSSVFQQVLFVATSLVGADLRRSFFDDCSFEKAAMKGAILTYQQGKALPISHAQGREIDWRNDHGPEPKGG
jgi:BTB/POZ domain-containing protein KCTD9